MVLVIQYCALHVDFFCVYLENCDDIFINLFFHNSINRFFEISHIIPDFQPSFQSQKRC